MTRRLILTLVLVPILRAQALETLTQVAAMLSEGNAPGALKMFNRNMAGYKRIETGIESLTEQTDVVCSIDLLSDRGDDSARSVEADWFLQLRSKAEDGPLERRRERVQLQIQKQGTAWKITKMEPLSILDPLEIR